MHVYSTYIDDKHVDDDRYRFETKNEEDNQQPTYRIQISGASTTTRSKEEKEGERRPSLLMYTTLYATSRQKTDRQDRAICNSSTPTHEYCRKTMRDVEILRYHRRPCVQTSLDDAHIDGCINLLDFCRFTSTLGNTQFSSTKLIVAHPSYHRITRRRLSNYAWTLRNWTNFGRILRRRCDVDFDEIIEGGSWNCVITRSCGLQLTNFSESEMIPETKN